MRNISAITGKMSVIISLASSVSGHLGFLYSQGLLQEDSYGHGVIQMGRDLWVSPTLTLSHLSQVPSLGCKEMLSEGTAS